MFELSLRLGCDIINIISLNNFLKVIDPQVFCIHL